MTFAGNLKKELEATFNKLANEDQFGRDIILPGGNVSSRILPVKINGPDQECFSVALKSD